MTMSRPPVLAALFTLVISSVAAQERSLLQSLSPVEVRVQAESVDYIGPDQIGLASLDHQNFTVYPALPPEIAVLPAVDPLITWDANILAINKKLYQDGDNVWALDAVEAILKLADEVIDIMPIWDVTNKSATAMDADPRAYLSLAEFYWPTFVSRTNPEGLPYTFQAGRNPGVVEIAPNYFMLSETIDDVHDLSLAFYFTGKQKYSDRARQKLYTWFLDPERSMLPNLEYASIIRSDTGSPLVGRVQGIYDFNDIGKLLNGVTLLELAGGLSAADLEGLRAWFSQYSTWLETSPFGNLERQQVNYHGTGFDAQLAQIYIFLNERDKAGQIVYYGKDRLKYQIENSVMVLERDRGRSLDFIQQNLMSWVDLGKVGSKLGINIWESGIYDGSSFKGVFDFMRPYWESLGVTWPYKQVGVNRVREAARLVPHMYMAYSAIGVENSGPLEYISLYRNMFPSFDTAAQQSSAVSERLPAIRLDTNFARDGIDRIRVCRSLFCETNTLLIFGFTLLALTLVAMCLCWNCHIHSRADNMVELPDYLTAIHEQQIKLQELGLRVEPAKPSFMDHIQEEQGRQKLVDEARSAKAIKEREVKMQIKSLEKQKRVKKEERESRMHMQSNMHASGMPGMSNMGGQGYQPSYAGSVGGSSMYQGSQVGGYHPRQVGNDSSFVLNQQAAARAAQPVDTGFSFPNSNQKDAEPPTPVSSHSYNGSFSKQTSLEPMSPMSTQHSTGNNAPSASISTLLANAQGLLAEYDEKTGELSKQI